jgi:hypothetical protein
LFVMSAVSVDDQLAPLFLGCDEAEHHGEGYGGAELLTSWDKI